MPGKCKPSKVSQATNRNKGSKDFALRSNGHLCQKSPTGSHWWQIGSPDGATSAGVCWYCGEQRQFANTLEASFSLGRK